MNMKFLLLVGLVFATASSAQVADSFVLDDGPYQLIWTVERSTEANTEHVLSTVVVRIFHKDGKPFISLDGGIDTEIRTGAQQTFVISFARPDMEGSLALERVFAGRQVLPQYSEKPAAVRRMEGQYREIWASGELKGEFALYPISPKTANQSSQPPQASGPRG
jgi:hypothetical protein